MTMQANELLNAQPTPEDVRRGLQITLAVTETIREAGEVPSGTLYAMLCDKLTLEAYERMIAMIKRTGLVKEENHLLRWVGPHTGVSK